jgi:hypothetical protein
MMNKTSSAPPSPAGQRSGARHLAGPLKSALTEPAGLCARAALIVAVFPILHALGALYLFFWFGTIPISPSLMIAGGILWLARRKKKL